MLEWYAKCASCGAPIMGVALPPWSWFTKLLGKRCRTCGHVTPPSELYRQGVEYEKAHRAKIEKLRAESSWAPPGGWPPL